MSKFKQLHDRVLQDPSFRARLTNQTKDTLRSVGIEPTPGLVGDVKAALRQLTAGEIRPKDRRKRRGRY